MNLNDRIEALQGPPAEWMDCTVPLPRILRERDPLHDWQLARLLELGLPPLVAEQEAGRVDWHELASLVQAGATVDQAWRICS